MAIHVVNEARRCLNCKKPMCREGCPIHTPIPDMIQLFLNGKSNEAGQMLFENNPLSVVCSLVCDYEKQCEGHCVRVSKGNRFIFPASKTTFRTAILTGRSWSGKTANANEWELLAQGRGHHDLSTAGAERV